MSPRNISQKKFQQREIELIDLARNLVEKNGLNSLTIDKLVAESRFSKGTIYKHFNGKEDLLMAICNTCIAEIQIIFTKSLQFIGNGREKILAVMVSYIIWAKLHPSQLFIVLSAHSPSVSACSSNQRNQDNIAIEAQLMGLMNNEIEKAIESGELVIPKSMTLEHVTFALWSASWGAMALIMSKGNSVNLGPLVLERESYTNTQLLLDGFGWKPLSKDWNYAKTIRKIADQIFKTEIKELKNMGNDFVFI